MLSRHLRSNVVAYLALVVALTTGTAYAAVQVADGSITAEKLAKNSVTSPKIKKSAVKSSDVKDGQLASVDVKDHSLTAADLAPGVVPSAAWVAGRTYIQADPAATPDTGLVNAYTFTLPRAGRLQVEASFNHQPASCDTGQMYYGAYLDGNPVPGSAFAASSPDVPRTSVSVTTISAGAHTLTVGADCAAGSPTAYSLGSTYSLVLAD
jgi:hypothetical protein